MPNSSIHLSLPSELKKKAQSQAEARHFSSTSDYLQHLIRNDIEKAEHNQKLEAFLLKGLNSGKGKKLSIKQLDSWMKDVINNASS